MAELLRCLQDVVTKLLVVDVALWLLFGMVVVGSKLLVVVVVIWNGCCCCTVALAVVFVVNGTMATLAAITDLESCGGCGC